MMNDFYTYAYLREDRTPYYIGKGTRDRIFSTNRKFKPPKDKLKIIFLKQNITEEEAFRHERYMISIFGRKDLETGILYNRTDGGEGCSGSIWSEERKRKRSELYTGENHPQYGKLRSEETRIKLSEINKGKTLSEKTKRKLSEINKGKTVSEETRRKLSEASKGNQSAKGNQNMKGRTHSEETKKKISEASKGRKWWNDGFVNKMSKECPGDNWVLGMKSRKG